jgi:hypothetical protein
LLYEQGEAAVGIAPASVAAGDPRLGGLIRLLGAAARAPVSLHVGAQLWIPVGGADQHVGDRVARFAPRAVVAGVRDWLRWSALAQLQFRREARIGALPTAAGNSVGSELQLGAAVAYASASQRFSVGPEVKLATVVTRGRSFERKFTSLELMLAGHYAPVPRWLVSAGVGLGALRAPGGPDTRLLLRVAYNAITVAP